MPCRDSTTVGAKPVGCLPNRLIRERQPARCFFSAELDKITYCNYINLCKTGLVFATIGSKPTSLFLKKDRGFGGKGKTFFPGKKSFSLSPECHNNIKGENYA